MWTAIALAAGTLLTTAIPPAESPPEARASAIREKLRYSSGHVMSVKDHHGWYRITVMTQTGPLVVDANPNVQVFGTDGVLLGSPHVLVQGERVGIHYLLHNGPKANDIRME